MQGKGETKVVKVFDRLFAVVFVLFRAVFGTFVNFNVWASEIHFVTTMMMSATYAVGLVWVAKILSIISKKSSPNKHIKYIFTQISSHRVIFTIFCFIWGIFSPPLIYLLFSPKSINLKLFNFTFLYLQPYKYMESSTVLWLLFSAIVGGLSFLYGRYLESHKNLSKKYDELSTEEQDSKSGVSLYREEPKDTSYLKKELDRERETKRKLVEQYESELSYLKSIIAKYQETSEKASSTDRQAKTQRLFEEMSNELGPIVQIIEGSHLSDDDDDDVGKAIDKEINLNP